MAAKWLIFLGCIVNGLLMVHYSAPIERFFFSPREHCDRDRLMLCAV